MSNPLAIEAIKLSKNFGTRQAVQDASLRLEQGQVLGLIGPNGAGKTTLLRMLVGLIRPAGGSVRLFGFDVQQELELALFSVGAIIENPDMYKFLTGRQNLTQYARMRSDVSRKQTAETVDFVGLTDRIDEKITHYSLGMRQRLGIAQALLHRPRLLILDEPTNGLDPAGMQDIRRMVRHLAEERGLAVLISSHLLHDVQAICDSVAILKEGRVLAAGPVNAFLQDAIPAFRFGVDDLALATTLAAQNGWQVSTPDPETKFLVVQSDQPPDVLNKFFVHAGIRVSRIESAGQTLEETFLELTGDTEVNAE